jgi:hypothetical protein
MPFVYYHKNQQLTQWHVTNEKGLNFFKEIDNGSSSFILVSFKL